MFVQSNIFVISIYWVSSTCTILVPIVSTDIDLINWYSFKVPICCTFKNFYTCCHGYVSSMLKNVMVLMLNLIDR